jgi:hypothetical protein
MTDVAVRPEAQLEPIQVAERKLIKSVAVGVAIALATSVFSGSWVSALCIGAVVGAFGGAFFGGWAGSLVAAHALDAADGPIHA